MNKKLLIGLAVILVAAAIAFGYWYYQIYKKAGINALEQAGNSADDLSKKASQGVLPSIDPQSNPMENAPDTNPVSRTNPFSGIKINPFK